jgi:hypothetical protein
MGDRIVGGWQIQGHLHRADRFTDGIRQCVVHGKPARYRAAEIGSDHQSLLHTAAGFNTVAAQQLESNYRTFPSRLTGARNPGWNLWAMSIIKSTRIRESVNFEVRAEAKNALNHPNFVGPNLTPTSPLFGTISSAQGSRVITLQGKLNW